MFNASWWAYLGVWLPSRTAGPLGGLTTLADIDFSRRCRPPIFDINLPNWDCTPHGSFIPGPTVSSRKMQCDCWSWLHPDRNWQRPCIWNDQVGGPPACD